MLVRTWTVDGWREKDENGKYVECERTNHYGAIMPDCCEAAKIGMAVTLQPSEGSWRDPDLKPVWRVGTSLPRETWGLIISAKGYGTKGITLEVKYCPYCGEALPDVEKNPDPPEPLVNLVGHEECGTCGEDSPFGCGCLRPEMGWRPVQNDSFWKKLEKKND